MQTITTRELKAKMDRSEPFHLVMTLTEAAFRRARIPGSIHLGRPQDMARLQDRDAEIVVYCSGPECAASRMAYRRLERDGYRALWHYRGGLSAWSDHGLSLEGTDAEAPRAHVRKPRPAAGGPGLSAPHAGS